MSGIRVVLQGKGAVPVEQGDTVLDALIKGGADPEYHCKQGHCGACIIKKLDGDVRYDEEPIASVGDDEIVPCCAYPFSNTVVIEAS